MAESETQQKHPTAIAWEKWLASDEGQQCRTVSTLAHRTNSTYLENRLWRAFTAGANSSPSDAEQLVELRKLAQTSLDLLTDIYRSHASQRFSAVRLSPICAHVRELQTLLNTKKSDRCPHGIYRRLVKCALCDQFEVNTDAE